MTKQILFALLYLVAAPILGGLLAGVDRIITARMQSRIGPPLLQPFYDVAKLFGKQGLIVSGLQNFYIWGFFLFTVLTGCIFFAGGDLLLAIFALTVGGVFLALAAFSANSPYATVGAERELLQMMAYEPMVILMALGFFAVTGSFRVSEIITHNAPLIKFLPGIFIGFMFILTIKLRKSPFDLSTSHHGHQELVKGLTTEISGPALGLVEIAHWYENILLLGMIYLFFAFNPWIGLAAIVLGYGFEILIDNSYARLRWQFTITSSWVVAILLGAINLIVVHYLVK